MGEERSSLRPPAIVVAALALMVGGYATTVLGEHLQQQRLLRARAEGWITFSTGISLPQQHPLTSAGVLAVFTGAVVICCASSYRLLTTARGGILREAALAAGATVAPSLFVGCLLFGAEPRASALVPAWMANPELALICTPAVCAWLVVLAWRLSRPAEAQSVTGASVPSPTKGAPR